MHDSTLERVESVPLRCLLDPRWRREELHAFAGLQAAAILPAVRLLLADRACADAAAAAAAAATATATIAAAAAAAAAASSEGAAADELAEALAGLSVCEEKKKKKKSRAPPPAKPCEKPWSSLSASERELAERLRCVRREDAGDTDAHITHTPTALEGRRSRPYSYSSLVVSLVFTRCSECTARDRTLPPLPDSGVFATQVRARDVGRRPRGRWARRVRGGLERHPLVLRSSTRPISARSRLTSPNLA